MTRGSARPLMLLILLLTGCVSVANVSDFPQDLSQVKFGELQFDGPWQYDYEFELSEVSDKDFFAAAKPALTSNGFSIVKFDTSQGVIIAKRGLRANEWASVVGVYRKPESQGGDTKILFKVTQDFTGSFINRGYSENIANRIRRYLDWHASGEAPYGEERR